VGELVEDGDPDLLLELGRVGERLDERPAEDPDPVGQRPRLVVAFRQRHALVESEQVGIVGMLVLDRELEVPDSLPELGRERPERPFDVLLEGQ